MSYSKKLGEDDTHYRDVLDSLPSYYRDENGYLLIAPNAPFDHSHRHFSHMLMYKNLEMVDPYLERETIKKDIDKVISFGTKRWVGFSFTEMSSLMSYVRDGESAFKYLSAFEEAFVHPNGFHMNNDYKGLGYSDMDCYVMTLEANMGYVRALADMMVQDALGVVSIFPAINSYMAKKGVSFEKLRIKGNHQISAKLKEDRISLNVLLSKEDTLVIENCFGENPVFLVDGERETLHSDNSGFLKIKAKERIDYEGVFVR